MGRLFVIDLEGPVYKCKHCKLDFSFHEDPINRIPPLLEYLIIHGILYYFSKCFNVLIGTDQVMIDLYGESESPMRRVFCIGCGSHISVYDESAVDTMYNEGNFYINRLKLHGPPDGSDDENPGYGLYGSDYENSGNEED